MCRSNVIIEITESGLIDAAYRARWMCSTRLRMKNIQLSIDDFGTGYAMMQQLLKVQYPATELKIDRSFVHGYGHVTTATASWCRRPIPSSPAARSFSLAKEHTLVPVCRTLAADLETPVSAFLRAAWPERECFCWSRWRTASRWAATPSSASSRSSGLWRGGARSPSPKARRSSRRGRHLRRAAARAGGHKPARLPGLPPFTAGAVGFFSYDAVRQIERLPELAKDELGVPDACLLFFDEVLAFDHVRKEIWLVVTADVTRGKPADAYDKAVARLDKLEKRLAQPLPKLAARKPRQAEGEAPHAKKDFLAAVLAPRSTSRRAISFRQCCRSASTWSRRRTASRSIARCAP
jgi:hypothetical protein